MEQIVQFTTRHWQLSLILLIILILIVIDELLSKKNKPSALSPEQVVNYINHFDAVVIDLRDEKNYRDGHIIDSIRATTEDFSRPKIEKYKQKPIILVCTRGLQSQALAAKLRKNGYTNVLILQGGISSWMQAELPLVKGKK